MDGALVISGEAGMALIRDGEVHPLLSTPTDFSAPIAAPVDDTTLAVQTDDLLVLVDVTTGDITSRPCGDCSGVGWSDGALYTVDSDFTLMVYDEQLVQTDAVKLRHTVEPAGDYPDPQPPDPTVIGVLDGQIVVQHTPPTAYRGGPTGISYYRPDGTPVTTFEIDGKYGSSMPTPDGDGIVVKGWSSGGACYTASSLTQVEVEGKRTEIPIDEIEGPEGLALYVDEMQWRGGRLWLPAHREGNGEFGGSSCVREGLGLVWDPEAGLQEVQTADVNVFADADCDSGLGRTPGSSDLVLIGAAGQERYLTGYSQLVWAPRLDTGCGPSAETS